MKDYESVKKILDNKRNGCEDFWTHEFMSAFGNVTISRSDYEDLALPMIAGEMSDKQMQEIVDKINLSMQSDYDQEQLGWLQEYRYAEKPNLTEEQLHFADKMSEREFEHFEGCAREVGMRYYEDLDDEEYNAVIAAAS
jgi:hypothetical protein